SACHRHIRTQCEALLDLAQNLPHYVDQGTAPGLARSILHELDTWMARHHADEESGLFPTLIESMAGSDAVCLRGMTQHACDEHRTLESIWRKPLRMLLEQIADHEPASLPVAATQAFTTRYLELIAHEDDELLPMAERLLTDNEIDTLRHRMQARQAERPA
ncbi:MAG: hemerythrin domain-containing protein, partial [Alcaligenaceae bacterium]|nr:hemerythrin domain-containing protein [Alcaligenaceae bacterium]